MATPFWSVSDFPRTSVVKYYLYKSTKSVEFYRPIMYLFFLAQGLSFTQIAILEALYNLTTVLGEIPTGYVGDRLGRRNSSHRRGLSWKYRPFVPMVRRFRSDGTGRVRSPDGG